MTPEQRRRKIVVAAARMLHYGEEGDYDRAKVRAIRKVSGGWVRRDDFPSNAEIRHELMALAYQQEQDWAAEHGDIDSHEEAFAPPDGERFEVYRALLLPLEEVAQPRKSHPEGDALYHSLQVFELVRDERPYDEELLLAALLHDVGKAIDPLDHVSAGLDALDGWITERVAWLIEHHLEARRVLDGTIGARARRRLAASEDFEDLMLLAECDRDGRVPGMRVPDVESALEEIRSLSELCE